MGRGARTSPGDPSIPSIHSQFTLYLATLGLVDGGCLQARQKSSCRVGDQDATARS